MLSQSLLAFVPWFFEERRTGKLLRPSKAFKMTVPPLADPRLVRLLKPMFQRALDRAFGEWAPIAEDRRRT